MSAALTLPGTIPGLLRRGSPVIDDRGRRAAVTVWFVRQDFVTWTIVGDDLDEIPKWQHGEGLPAGVALDLTDATGRAHAAWWLAHATMPQRHNQHLTASWRFENGAWSLTTAGGTSWWSGVRCPAIAHLNPDDDTRLPDGSRWVDAEALRLVCLHVAGVQP